MAKLDYKHAIKSRAAEFESNNADELCNHLAEKDSVKFWSTWNKKFCNRSTVSPTFEGNSDPADNVNSFQKFYSKIYVNSANDLLAVNEFQNAVYNDRTRFDRPSPVNVNSIDHECQQSLSFDIDCIEGCCYPHH
jgi:hypothetical protein